MANLSISYVTSDGFQRDEYGNIMDPNEPSVATIPELTNAPRMTHKGNGFVWFGATLICIINTLSIFFTDELFRWNLAFRIRNADHTEPSDWEIAGRYVGWTVMTIAALVLFMICSGADIQLSIPYKIAHFFTVNYVNFSHFSTKLLYFFQELLE